MTSAMTSSATEGRVEHGDALLRCRLKVDLVCSNAEAADDDQVLGLLQHPLGELRLRADADDMHIADLLNQLVLWQAGLDRLDLVALVFEDLHASIVYVLEQQDLDVLGVERLQLFRELCG
jgi:hypothetical protein